MSRHTHRTRNHKVIPHHFRAGPTNLSLEGIKTPYVPEPVIHPRPVLVGLTRRQTKLLKKLAHGWQVGLGNGLLMLKGKLRAKVRLDDIKALLERKLLSARFALTDLAWKLLGGAPLAA